MIRSDIPSSAIAILNQYIDGASRHTISSIDIEQGENPEDFFYLCCINDEWYVVYETDYVGSLGHVAKEAADIFPGHQPTGWLPKKGSHSIAPGLEVADDDKQTRQALILEVQNSYLRYGILKMRPATPVNES